MRRPATVITLLLAIGAAWLAARGPTSRAPYDAPTSNTPRTPIGSSAPARDDESILAAVRSHAQDAPVDGRGRVLRVLPDDREGNPHQRFLMQLDDGTTVLVAHNIALAPRLDGLAAGDLVEFRGDYVWNEKGGALHWTHRDPHGTHRDGWLRWRGRTYD
ncbi:DUF3465 domain-containing protein [Cognatilysobacter terrigena]|uniref:DUF3465 domain-containing protein n=1 Tax=Cognatilysobacter terrigena TaxID=2488749 RepID=UPI0010602378|nr:DUF3465 domain-containing protein [Lysobacter terrigena]